MQAEFETDEAAHDAVRGVTRLLIAQAFALDRMFVRVAKEAFSGDAPSRREMSKALNAQARCRMTFKVLIALRGLNRDEKIFSNSAARTIQTLKTTCIANSLLKEVPAAAPPRTRAPRKHLGSRKRWTPERRARQAAAIRAWQPWQKSTGP